MNRLNVLEEKDFLFLTNKSSFFQSENALILTNFVSQLEKDTLVLFSLRPHTTKTATLFNVFRIIYKFKESEEEHLQETTLTHINVLSFSDWEVFLRNVKISMQERKEDFYIYSCTEEETNFIVDSYSNIFEKSDLSGFLNMLFDKEFVPTFNPQTFQNW